MLRVLCLFCSLLASALGQQQQQIVFAGHEEPSLFMLSIDGLRYDYLTDPAVKLPNLRRLMQMGSYSLDVESVYPSVTYPSHTTMVTGVNPSRHGILANDHFDPEQPDHGLYIMAADVRVPSIFDAAHALGWETSAIYWPVTAFSTAISTLLPDLPIRNPVEADFVFRGCRRGKAVLDQVDSVEALMFLTDKDRADIAISVIRDSDLAVYPRIQALHLVAFDHFQHVNGVKSLAAISKLEEEDQHLGRLLSDLSERGKFNSTTFMVMADHGFTNITQFVSPGVILSSLGLLGAGKNWIVSQYAAAGTYALYLNPNLPPTTRPKIYRQIQNTINFLLSDSFSGINQAYIGRQVEVIDGFKDAFVILEGKLGTVFSTSTEGPIFKSGPAETYRATHGYNPTEKDMKTAFIAVGPGIAKGRDLGPMKLIDIAPTINHIMDLGMTEMDGKFLRMFD